MIQLRAMGAAEFPAYRRFFIDEYAADLAANQGYALGKALARAAQSIDGSLPAGVVSEQHTLLCIQRADSAELLGYLWYTLWDDGESAFILDFAILPQHQRRGYGSASLNALENRLVAQGIFQLKLRVAADNPRAKKLYEQSEFAVTGFNMAKTLTRG